MSIEVKQRFEDMNSGKQDLAIVHHIDRVPPIAISANRERIAFGNGNKIELLEMRQVVDNSTKRIFP